LNKSKPHHYIAGIVDFYIASFFINSLLGLIGLIFNMLIPLLVLWGCIPVLILFLIFYYRIICKKINWLSPGEIIAGRIINDRYKEWVNPYGINRFFLFFTIIFTLVIFGNSWDGLSRGEIYYFNEWFTLTVSLLLLTIGYVGAGKNKNWWIIPVLLPIVYFTMGAFYLDPGNLRGSEFQDERVQTYISNTALYMYAGLLSINLFTYIIYRFIQKPDVKYFLPKSINQWMSNDLDWGIFISKACKGSGHMADYIGEIEEAIIGDKLGKSRGTDIRDDLCSKYSQVLSKICPWGSLNELLYELKQLGCLSEILNKTDYYHPKEYYEDLWQRGAVANKDELFFDGALFAFNNWSPEIFCSDEINGNNSRDAVSLVIYLLVSLDQMRNIKNLMQSYSSL